MKTRIFMTLLILSIPMMSYSQTINEFIYGHNPDIDTGTGEIISDLGASQTFPTAAGLTTVVSDSTNDNAVTSRSFITIACVVPTPCARTYSNCLFFVNNSHAARADWQFRT